MSPAARPEREIKAIRTALGKAASALSDVWSLAGDRVVRADSPRLAAETSEAVEEMEKRLENLMGAWFEALNRTHVGGGSVTRHGPSRPTVALWEPRRRKDDDSRS